jgi:hypothetical protein
LRYVTDIFRGRGGLAPVLVGLLAMLLLSACGVPSADEHIRNLPAVPATVVSGDFDGNGTEDVMVGYPSEYLGLTEVTQDGYGFWTKHELSTIVLGSELLATTDLDGDGGVDLIAAGKSLESLNVLHNKGDGTFTNSVKALAPASPPGDTHITAITSATAPSGKHLVAIAYSTEDPEAFVKPRSVAVYEAKNGGLTIANLFQFFEPVPGEAKVIKLADVDRDGRLDLLVGTTSGTLQIYRGLSTSDGAFESAPTTLSASGQTKPITAIAVGDVQTPVSAPSLGSLGGWSTDGKYDVVAGFEGAPNVYGWRGQGGMSFTTGVLVGGVNVAGEIWPEALSIDPAGSGDWGGVMTGPPSGFAENDSGLTPILFKTASPNPEGPCSSHAAALFHNDSPDTPFAAALACDENKVLTTIPERKRLKVPGPIAFGSQRAGTAGTATNLPLSAPDFASAQDDEDVTGGIFVEKAQLTGPDAGDFTLTDSGEGCGLSVVGICHVQVQFTPHSPGEKHAVVVIESDGYRAAGTPFHSVALSGTGTGGEVEAPASVALGDVAFGGSQSAGLTLKNTGNEALTISELLLEEAGPGWSATLGACTAALAPGASCQAQVKFQPAAAGNASASLRVKSSGVGSEPVVALSARGIASGVTAAPVEIGEVRVGQSGSVTAAVTNSGTSSLQVTAIEPVGPDAARLAIGTTNCLSGTIAPGAHCQVEVTAAPSARGPLDASLHITSNAPSSPNVVVVDATGIQGVLDAPASADLGGVRLGSFAEQTIHLSNSGDAPLDLGALSLEGPLELSADACSSQTLAVGAGCELIARFAPTATGPASAELTIPNDGEGGTRTIDLTGLGLPIEGPGTEPPPGGAPLADPAQLTVSVHGARSVRRGKVTRLRIEVDNTGGQTAAGVKLRLRLPAALRAQAPRGRKRHGRSPLSIGDLAAHGSRTIAVTLRVLPKARVGAAVFAVLAEAGGLATGRASGRLHVR